jgi:predicted nucleic acid-binding protein
MITTPVACVIDASVGIKLVVAEALSAQAHDLFARLAADPAARFWVPDLFYIECTNILWKHVQRSAYSLASAQLNLAALAALDLNAIAITSLIADALAIAAAHGVSAYDACYVAAAQHAGAPLITADSRLAARLAGTPYAVLDLATLSIPPVPPPPP